MRTMEEIRARIETIRGDARMGYKPANVQINAPLALIQVEGEAKARALEWVLGVVESCDGSFPESDQERKVQAAVVAKSMKVETTVGREPETVKKPQVKGGPTGG